MNPNFDTIPDAHPEAITKKPAELISLENWLQQNFNVNISDEKTAKKIEEIFAVASSTIRSILREEHSNKKKAFLEGLYSYIYDELDSPKFNAEDFKSRLPKRMEYLNRQIKGTNEARVVKMKKIESGLRLEHFRLPKLGRKIAAMFGLLSLNNTVSAQSDSEKLYTQTGFTISAENDTELNNNYKESFADNNFNSDPILKKMIQIQNSIDNLNEVITSLEDEIDSIEKQLLREDLKTKDKKSLETKKANLETDLETQQNQKSKKETELSKLKQDYAMVKKVSSAKLDTLLAGERLAAYDTPDDLGVVPIDTAGDFKKSKITAIQNAADIKTAEFGAKEDVVTAETDYLVAAEEGKGKIQDTQNANYQSDASARVAVNNTLKQRNSLPEYTKSQEKSDKRAAKNSEAIHTAASAHERISEANVVVALNSAIAEELSKENPDPEKIRELQSLDSDYGLLPFAKEALRISKDPTVRNKRKALKDLKEANKIAIEEEKAKNPWGGGLVGFNGDNKGGISDIFDPVEKISPKKTSETTVDSIESVLIRGIPRDKYPLDPEFIDNEIIKNEYEAGKANWTVHNYAKLFGLDVQRLKNIKSENEYARVLRDALKNPEYGSEWYIAMREHWANWMQKNNRLHDYKGSTKDGDLMNYFENIFDRAANSENPDAILAEIGMEIRTTNNSRLTLLGAEKLSGKIHRMLNVRNSESGEYVLAMKGESTIVGSLWCFNPAYFNISVMYEKAAKKVIHEHTTDLNETEYTKLVNNYIQVPVVEQRTVLSSFVSVNANADFGLRWFTCPGRRPVCFRQRDLPPQYNKTRQMGGGSTSGKTSGGGNNQGNDSTGGHVPTRTGGGGSTGGKQQ